MRMATGSRLAIYGQNNRPAPTPFDKGGCAYHIIRCIIPRLDK